MDQITEAIAHFVGLFETTVEQARLRKAYHEFQAQQPIAEQSADLPNLTVKVNASYDFAGFQPEVHYFPAEPEILPEKSSSAMYYAPPVVWIEGFFPAQHVYWGHPGGWVSPRADHFESTRVLQIQPPGSVAVYVEQNIRLSDNDYMGVGGHGLSFAPPLNEGRIGELLAAADGYSPFAGLQTPGSGAEMIAFIEAAAASLNAYGSAHEGDTNVNFFQANLIGGIFVNGAMTDALPEISLYRPAEEEEPETESATSNSFNFGGRSGNEMSANTDIVSDLSVDGEGVVTIDAFVELQAGGNTLVNSVVLVNDWLIAPVFAAVGDHFEINAVFQINAWNDSDAVGDALGAWKLDTEHPTLGFNIASFLRTDGGGETAASPIGEFPSNWAVTQITGDLIILNWIEQFTFMLDNDISIIASSGVKTTITAGENSAFNDITLQELGYNYDLIIVGGSIYDANFIHQMNVLFDADLIGAVDGFGTGGGAMASTAGNLLWNQANIVQIGGGDRFSPLSEHYAKAADNLKNGVMDLPDQILKDSAFAGLEALRVLYVSGNYLNLQYLKQTNVLGDSDQVALAMNAVRPVNDADWTVSTGANTLVNYAGIYDVDAGGKTYVGGQQYSDEILIQAELISSNPLLGARNPDMLVNEAVAFLGDGMLSPDGGHGQGHGQAHYGLPSIDAPHPDVMQTMLA